jgi:hypothetical protein
MSEQILEQLFDSPIKVKLLKLFLRNSSRHFSLPEIIKKTQGKRAIVKKHVVGLESIKFLNVKKVKTSKKKGIIGGLYYTINQNFDFYPELQTLVLKSSPTCKETMLKRILKLGKIKMALIGGVFLNTDNYRVDLFLVGDDISNRKLRNFLADMEAEVGKEIEYAAMDMKEFNYRFSMFDRFVRDVLEKPHEKLINKVKRLEAQSFTE